MGFLDRIFRKESKVARLAVTRGVGGQKWTERRYETFAREAYMRNVVAFRCVYEIATSVSAAGWEVYKVGSGGVRAQVQDHWLNDLIVRANPGQSFPTLLTYSISYLLLSGDGFMERVALEWGPNGGTVKELYALRPDKMKLMFSGGKLSSYRYSESGGEGADFPVDALTGQSDLLHIKLFNPLDADLGMSLMHPTGREIDTSNEAINWNKSLLENQGRPGLVFTVVGNLSEDQWDDLERQLEGRTGAEGAGKNIIIEGERGTSVTPYNFSPAEMDWLEGNRDTSRRICYGFGVPPVLMGIPGDSTYNNQKEARQAFWDTTVLYYLNLYRAEMNNWLMLRDQKMLLDYSLDDVPAMEYRRTTKWERAEKSDFLSINEKRELAGYESWGEEGDVILVPATMIPLGMSAPEEAGAVPGAGAGDEEDEGDGEDETGDEGDAGKDGADEGDAAKEGEKQRATLRRLGYSEEQIDEFLEDPRRFLKPSGKGNGKETAALLREIADNVKRILEQDRGTA
jgi:HK97 family phage portal protein